MAVAAKRRRSLRALTQFLVELSKPKRDVAESFLSLRLSCSQPVLRIFRKHRPPGGIARCRSTLGNPACCAEALADFVLEADFLVQAHVSLLLDIIAMISTT
jgi:hypothetical protein